MLFSSADFLKLNGTTFSGVNLVWNLGIVDPGKKNSILSGKFPENFNFSRQIINKFRFFRQFKNKFWFPGKNWSFTAISEQIIIFLFKNHHFL